MGKRGVIFEATEAVSEDENKYEHIGRAQFFPCIFSPWSSTLCPSLLSQSLICLPLSLLRFPWVTMVLTCTPFTHPLFAFPNLYSSIFQSKTPVFLFFSPTVCLLSIYSFFSHSALWLYLQFAALQSLHRSLPNLCSCLCCLFSLDSLCPLFFFPSVPSFQFLLYSLLPLWFPSVTHSLSHKVTDDRFEAVIQNRTPGVYYKCLWRSHWLGIQPQVF